MDNQTAMHAVPAPGDAPLRIVHVINSLAVGGAETVLLRLVAGADARRYRHSVVSLTDDGPIGERLRSCGVETYFGGMSRGRFSVAGFLRVSRIIRRLTPHVVQTWMYHSDLLGGVAARLTTQAPVVWGIHHTSFAPGTKATTRLTRIACAVASRVIPARIVSCSAQALEVHRTLGYSTSAALFIPNGIDTETFTTGAGRRAAARKAWAIPETSLVVGMAARYTPQKNFPGFLQMAKDVVRRRPSTRFLLCGPGVGEDNAVLSRTIERAGLTAAVRLLGPLSDMPQFYSALDVFALSSSGEAFPVVIGEAMASGIPCAAYDVGDCRWMIGDTGFIAPGSAEGLAEAVDRLLDMPAAERAALGTAARERVRAEFDLPRMLRRYHQLYEEVSGRGNPADANR